MAGAILKAALKTETDAVLFSQRVLSRTTDSFLIEVYKTLAGCEKKRVSRIRSQIARYEAQNEESPL